MPIVRVHVKTRDHAFNIRNTYGSPASEMFDQQDGSVVLLIERLNKDNARRLADKLSNKSNVKSATVQ